MEMETILNLAPTILTLIVGVVGGFGGYYILVKGKLHEFNIKLKQASDFVDSMDKAIYDDKVSEQEFRNSFEAGKKLVGK